MKYGQYPFCWVYICFYILAQSSAQDLWEIPNKMGVWIFQCQEHNRISTTWVQPLGSNNVCICGSLGTQAYLYVQQQVCQHISPIMHWTWSALHHVYHVKTYFMCKHNFYMYDIYIPTSISLPRTTNIYVNDFHPHCTEDPALKDSQSTISSPAM